MAAYGKKSISYSLSGVCKLGHCSVCVFPLVSFVFVHLHASLIVSLSHSCWLVPLRTDLRISE